MIPAPSVRPVPAAVLLLALALAAPAASRAESSGSLEGAVTDFGSVPLAGVTVRILNTSIPPAKTDAAGLYTIPGIPAGTGYDAVFGLLPTYGAAAAAFAAEAGQATIEDATLPDAETFEEGNGAYTGDPPWQWGSPSVVGPPGAFSGTKCWGTNLSGNYPDNTTAYLTSHVLDPTGLPYLSLSFTHYYDTQAGFDGGNVQVNDGSGWITVAPVGGYPAANVPGLGNQPGWSGASGGWQPAVFDITPYSHSHLRIRFHFGSDAFINGPGWYIDDVAIYAYSAETGIGEPAAKETSIRLVPAQPNPFRDGSVISFLLPGQGGTARLRILDAGGRVIRELYDGWMGAGWQAVRWDGMDTGGRSVPAGVYYCVLEAGGTVVARPMVRLR